MEILSYLTFIGVLVCHILICVKIIQSGQTALGIVLLALFLCCGIGFFITLIYGWVKAKPLNISTLMIVYTVLFVGNLAIGGARFNEIKAQIYKQLGKEAG